MRPIVGFCALLVFTQVVGCVTAQAPSGVSAPQEREAAAATVPANRVLEKVGRKDDVKFEQEPCPEPESVTGDAREEGSSLEVGFEKTVGNPKPTKIYSKYKCRRPTK